MDYHLPHHLMASVPHYNLKQLHEIMLRDPEYREKGVIVEGYFGDEDNALGQPDGDGRAGRSACAQDAARQPTSTTPPSSMPTSAMRPASRARSKPPCAAASTS